MRKLATYLVAVFAVLSVFYFGGHTVFAAPEVLTISPTSIRPVVNPGSVKTGSFQTINQGQQSYNVIIYAAPYSVKSENYTPDFLPIPGAPSVASWLHFSQTSGTVQPNQTLNIDYTLTVPPNTPAGGYYAVAFVETQAPKNTSGVIVNEQVGEIFYIQVAGPVVQSGKVLSWSSPFFQKPPLTYSLKLENSGGLHYFSNISIVVRDIFNTPKFTLTTQKVVLPETIRQISDIWTKTPSLGFFKVTGSATVLGRNVKLPTKYVLVMSNTVRIVFIIIAALIIVAFSVRLLVMRKRRTKYHRHAKKLSH
jgi:hypothetical protein